MLPCLILLSIKRILRAREFTQTQIIMWYATTSNQITINSNQIISFESSLPLTNQINTRDIQSRFKSNRYLDLPVTNIKANEFITQPLQRHARNVNKLQILFIIAVPKIQWRIFVHSLKLLPQKPDNTQYFYMYKYIIKLSIKYANETVHLTCQRHTTLQHNIMPCAVAHPRRIYNSITLLKIYRKSALEPRWELTYPRPPYACPLLWYLDYVPQTVYFHSHMLNKKHTRKAINTKHATIIADDDHHVSWPMETKACLLTYLLTYWTPRRLSVVKRQ